MLTKEGHIYILNKIYLPQKEIYHQSVAECT